MKLNYTKKEVGYLKETLYFTDEEEEILEYWLKGYSHEKISFIMHLSTATISRRKKSIREKLEKLKSS